MNVRDVIVPGGSASGAVISAWESSPRYASSRPPVGRGHARERAADGRPRSTCSTSMATAATACACTIVSRPSADGACARNRPDDRQRDRNAYCVAPSVIPEARVTPTACANARLLWRLVDRRRRRDFRSRRRVTAARLAHVSP